MKCEYPKPRTDPLTRQASAPRYVRKERGRPGPPAETRSRLLCESSRARRRHGASLRGACRRACAWVGGASGGAGAGVRPDDWRLFRPVLRAVVRSTSVPRALPPICFGHIAEWHLVPGNAFCHLAFHLSAGLGQPAVVIAPPLFHPRLVPVGAVADPLGGDGVEQLPVRSGLRTNSLCRAPS